MHCFRIAALLGAPLLTAACGASSLDLPASNDASTDAIVVDAGADDAHDASPPDVGAPIRPHALAFDDDAVYFSDGPIDGGALRRYSRHDDGVTTLYAPPASRLLVWPIAKDAAHIYFATSTDLAVSSIYAIPITGGAPTKLWDVPMYVTDFAIDATHLYWTGFSRVDPVLDAGAPDASSDASPDASPDASDGGSDDSDKIIALVMQGPLGGGDPVERYREVRREAMTLVLDGDALFFLTGKPVEYLAFGESAEGTIMRLAPNGDLATFAAHLKDPRAIAAHAGTVFWLERGTPGDDCTPSDGTLMRADAPGVARALQSGLAGAGDIATDDSHLYLSVAGRFCNAPEANGSVVRTAFDGTSSEAIASNILEPGALATFGSAFAYTADGRIYVVPSP